MVKKNHLNWLLQRKNIRSEGIKPKSRIIERKH
jgi:hypothetical protein